MKPAELFVRNPQTQTKHEILEKYAEAWGRIITGGRAHHTGGRRRPPHFIYVDACAGPGRYLRDADAPLNPGTNKPPFGSPIRAIRVLDRLRREAIEGHGLEITVNAILCEREPPVFARLKESLEIAELAGRVRETTYFEGLRNGEIALINQDFYRVANQVLRYTGQVDRFTLALLDPYGPKAIPYELVSQFVAGESNHRDVIIFFPYQRLNRTSGFSGTDVPGSQAQLANVTAMFGDDGKWMNLCQARPTGTDPSEDDEQRLVEHYRTRLLDADPEVTIKTLGLRAPLQEQTLFYLFLTTHNPSGALAMNKLLFEARLTERVLRLRHALARKVEAAAQKGQTSLFDPGEGAPTTQLKTTDQPNIDIESVAEEIYEEFAAQVVPYRNVRRFFADSDYWAKHIDSAMARLKKSGRAKYADLSNPEIITFTGRKGYP